MKNIKWYSVVGVTVVVLVTTMFIRVPLPSKGYFNFGDVAVVFAGLLLGRQFGAFAGGVGSALADVLGGFAIFAPLMRHGPDAGLKIKFRNLRFCNCPYPHASQQDQAHSQFVRPGKDREYR